MQPMMVSSIRKLPTTNLCLRTVIDEKLIIWEHGASMNRLKSLNTKIKFSEQSGKMTLTCERDVDCGCARTCASRVIKALCVCKLFVVLVCLLHELQTLRELP